MDNTNKAIWAESINISSPLVILDYSDSRRVHTITSLSISFLYANMALVFRIGNDQSDNQWPSSKGPHHKRGRHFCIFFIFFFVRDYTGVVKRPGDADVVVDGQS